MATTPLKSDQEGLDLKQPAKACAPLERDRMPATVLAEGVQSMIMHCAPYANEPEAPRMQGHSEPRKRKLVCSVGSGRHPLRWSQYQDRAVEPKVAVDAMYVVGWE